MKIRQILACSIMALVLSSLAQAEQLDHILPQPITLSDAVGNDQDNFFYTENTKGSYVIFSGAVPIKKQPTKESRNLFLLKVSNGSTVFYEKVEPGAPLKKLAGYTVPVGTHIDTTIHASRSNHSGLERLVFRVPTKGLYMTTNGKAPSLLHVDTAKAPVTGAALRSPENLTKELPRTEGFRVVFGATHPKKGAEPYVSSGTAPTSKLLKDITTGKLGSNPQQFTTFNNEVYFVADAADTNAPEIFKTVASGNTPTFSAVQVPALGVYPLHLTGAGTRLYFVSMGSSANPNSYLYYSSNGTTFDYVPTQDRPVVTNPTRLIPNAIGDSALGFVFFDSHLGKYLFGYVTSSSDTAVYPEVPNVTPGTTNFPDHITSTADYFFFSASHDSTAQRMMAAFVGGTGLEFVNNSINGGAITDVTEIAWVNATNGSLYFTGDTVIGGVTQTDILFKLESPDSASGDLAAVPLTTLENHYVKGARNLHGVSGGGNVARLYFTAPVNQTVNSEFAKDGTDHGTKPWIVR